MNALRSLSLTPTRLGLNLMILSSWRLWQRRKVSGDTPARWAASGRLTTLSTKAGDGGSWVSEIRGMSLLTIAVSCLMAHKMPLMTSLREGQKRTVRFCPV